MALLEILLSTEQFQCSICLDVFTNPVSTPCGHTFCITCLGKYWDDSAVCRCPLCKETFRKRPDLHINRTLREITDHFKSAAKLDTRTRRASQDSLPKPGALPPLIILEPSSQTAPPCSQVTDLLPVPISKISDQALFSTLVSGAKLTMKMFTLSSPVESKQVPVCLKHRKKLELFCKTDRMSVCKKCVKTGHTNHDVILAETASQINKSQVGETRKDIQEMIQERVKKVQEIKSSLEDIKTSAETEMEASLGAFRALVSSIERCQAELLEIIEIQRQVAECQAESLIQELEEEIEELRRKGDTLTHLLQSGEDVFYLQMKDWSDVSVNPDACMGNVQKTVFQLVETFQEELKRLPERSIRAPADSTPLVSQPKTQKIQEYAVDVTLDSNTAHPRLILSQDGKQVRCSSKPQRVSDNPERFERIFCVLAREGFSSGRHYWEVEVRDKTDWDLGVASHSVTRKGKVTVHPSHGFWFLSLRDNAGLQTQSSGSGRRTLNPQKIGVYVDYEKGQVSFYNVEARLHIYTFHGSFTDSIYPFFSPCTNKSGKNEAPLIITPVELEE